MATKRGQHRPEWPDKVMFAAMLTIIAGSIGTLFALLRIVGATVGKGVSSLFLMVPAPATLALCVAMIGFGAYAIRHQASVWVWVAVGAGVASLEAMGLVPLLSLLAIPFLVMSRLEGEETTHDDQIVPPSLWPDKALAASMLLLASAVVSIFQALLILGDNIQAPVLAENPRILAYVGIVAGVWGLLAAHEVFHLRRPWSGHIGAVLGVAALGLWGIGPALAIAAMVLLVKAERENEFAHPAGAA